MANFPTVAITKNVDAQSAMVAQAATAGQSLNGLDLVSQLAAVIANLLAGAYSAQLRVGANTNVPITNIQVYSQTVTPAATAGNTSAEQTFTMTGLATTDKVILNLPAAPTAGLSIGSVRVSATNTLAITIVNSTAGSLTLAAGTYVVIAFRS